MPTKKITKTTKSAKIKPDVPAQNNGTYVEGIGRRKTSIARVRLYPDAKEKKTTISVNGKPFEEYFPLVKQQKTVASPFKAFVTENYRGTVQASGGGLGSQAEAIRLGISRILVSLHPDGRPRLKALGYLKRDPRMVERKHPGLRKARRPQQWRKR